MKVLNVCVLVLSCLLSGCINREPTSVDSRQKDTLLESYRDFFQKGLIAPNRSALGGPFHLASAYGKDEIHVVSSDTNVIAIDDYYFNINAKKPGIVQLTEYHQGKAVDSVQVEVIWYLGSLDGLTHIDMFLQVGDDDSVHVSIVQNDKNVTLSGWFSEPLDGTVEADGRTRFVSGDTLELRGNATGLQEANGQTYLNGISTGTWSIYR